MTKILGRYIAKTLILATGLAAIIIVGILILMTLLGELKNIGEGDYGIIQAIFYVFSRLPNDLYQFSPLLVLLASIMGLSMLSNHRELMVMRAAGFSIRQIITSVLIAILILILAISVIGEWIGPNLSYQATIRKETAQNAGQAVVTAAGVWFHVDNNFIHVEQIMNRHLLEGVTRYQLGADHRLEATYYAKTLSLVDNKWQMNEVVKTAFYNDRTKSQFFPQIEWKDLKFNPNLLNIGLVDPSEMSLPKLVKFSNYLKQNGLQASAYEFDFWRRIFQPLASLVMILLAIPFVLGGALNRSTGLRILIGILFGFAFFILNEFLGQLCVVYQVPPIFAAALPLLLFVIVGVFFSKQLIKH